jgi:hypothetical protein
VKEGMSTGEFKSGDALATAHVLFDCLILIRTPHLYQQEGRELNEKRIREMVQCLTRQRHALLGSIERGNDAASELRRFQLKAIFFGPVALQTISIAFVR